MKLLIKVMYDGREYHGFQVQKNGVSVQEMLCRAAEKLFGFPCNVTGCSRTDSGVHALGFCAAITPKDEVIQYGAWCAVPAGKLHRAINPYLPDDISVIAAAYAEDDFHPRYNAVEKEYVYRIYDGLNRNPFLRGRAYMTGRPLEDDDIRHMNLLAAPIEGTHDFTSFMASGSKTESAVRTVKHAYAERSADGVVSFYISADGFLYNMVRIIVGTLLEMTYRKATPTDMAAVIESRSRSAAGPTAPPEGLYLRWVEYDRKIDWQCD